MTGPVLARKPPRDGVVTVASVPEGHAYVRHLSDPVERDRVDRLPDPRPVPAPSDPSVWWPPRMIDPAWVADNHRSFDVFHLHFGFDAQPVEDLRALVDTLRRNGIPLVQTVHDLRNPHHPRRNEHDRHLDVLIPAADELVTLTRGAADEIARRWGREATVLPHPHVVDLPSIDAPRAARAGTVVGIHLKSLRANVDPLPVVDTVAAAVAGCDDVVLRVDVHRDVMDPGGENHDAEVASRLRQAERDGLLRLEVHDLFSDEELFTYLRDEIDVSVLPYRFGTHSGWAEACHDLGTAVVAPDCGYYRDQHPCPTYGNNEVDGVDAASLADAVVTACRAAPPARPGRNRRTAERLALAREHERIYRRALDRVRG
ncbi:MAG: glycosyltransferase [Pseudonocardia sp.]|mgnify:CR=1 FL=1|uniref:glycosyltransferase n=1 Tax=unclassified Pseudonocardia TaxID=2619320 RepID=UPI0008697F6F|nr:MULTISPECIES: glycosyltransferase [unclassified Pseudonocardia]MBN9107361.1 glycosyltransferase [Pseudonocardia sp.]ODU26667.1 MAG: hypothetical protein ABS80_06595 [Pseudonocardia sp. SCN 72-51]ODV06602.1 MAG: hypothetical protein ABT15_12335 [Pseudonocardia sp. SCN 73-27]